MPTSMVDRRVYGALKGARERLRSFNTEEEVAQQLVGITRVLVDRSADALKAAMDTEDAEELESIRAGDRRRIAFDALGDAFARLHAGLTARVSTAVMMGEEIEDADRMTAYLDETTPSGFRGLSFQAALSVIEIARRWAGDYLPPEACRTVLPAVDAAIDAARAAHREAEREAGDAALAFRELEIARDHARRDYLAARNALLSAMALTGTTDQINRFMLVFDRVIRPGARRASVEDEPPTSDEG